jgi:2-beta-glucuronyltransferase
VTAPKKKAVILTGHFALQKRRANILWLSDELRAHGWHVTIITTGYSWISRLRGDRRFQSLYTRPKTGTQVIDDTLTNIFHYAPIHPFSLRNALLDRIARPLHKMFHAYWRSCLRTTLPGADLVVVESGPPIVLADLVSRYARQAALVYRVSDDVDLLGLPPFVRQAEQRHAQLFDRISMASPFLARKFTKHETVAIDPVGIPKKLYDADLPDPFGPDRAEYEAVCAGTTQFDVTAVLAIARLRPNWRLHILGRLRDKPPSQCPKNLVFHHEQPFEIAAGFIRHADIGLAPYLDRPGVEYQTHQSNRILQYRYFGLPIIGPKRLCDPSIPSIFGYSDTSDTELESTLTKAEKHNCARFETVPDWHDLYLRIVSTRKRPGAAFQNAEIDPPP